MSRCRCWNPRTHKPKKMRLRSDGWKRCYRCGSAVPGEALRNKWFQEKRERDGEMFYGPFDLRDRFDPSTGAHRVKPSPVTMWRSGDGAAADYRRDVMQGAA